MVSKALPLILIGGGALFLLGSNSKSKKKTAPKSEYSPDDLLVVDPECNYVLHHSDKWFVEQRRRMIKYALEGRFDQESAVEINESMLADYIPLCFSLGRHGVGPGVKDLWDANYNWIFYGLKGYESMPELLEKDAIKFEID